MRVLIVEDDQKLVSYLKKSLEAEGLSVDVAFDGNVEGVENVGGVLGFNAQGTVKDASVQGNVMGTNQVGGAFGLWRGGTDRSLRRRQVHELPAVRGCTCRAQERPRDRKRERKIIREKTEEGGLLEPSPSFI